MDRHRRDVRADARIGVVLSGGGARGAYEAGAISILGPALQERDERPTLFLGTSVGAINAAYMASSRHLDAEEQAAGLLDRWRQATKGNVIRPILSRQLPLTVLRYAGGLLSLPGVRVPSLLDPTPLAHSLAAVRVEVPAGARGWYVDGGTRLNTPIKRALDLGADRLVVIGTESIAEVAVEPEGHDNEPPDFGDGALHALHGTLVDPLNEDMRMLGNVNEFFTEGKHATAATRYRQARGKPPYRRVPYIFIAPDALKIDRSFICGLTDNQEGETLLHALVQLGKSLAIEGIEQPRELSLLQAEQCDSGQGFLYARPLDAAATEAFLRDWTNKDSLVR
jgi:predicted acylesterase/phospholipase RssA